MRIVISSSLSGKLRTLIEWFALTLNSVFIGLRLNKLTRDSRIVNTSICVCVCLAVCGVFGVAQVGMAANWPPELAFTGMSESFQLDDRPYMELPMADELKAAWLGLDAKLEWLGTCVELLFWCDEEPVPVPEWCPPWCPPCRLWCPWFIELELCWWLLCCCSCNWAWRSLSLGSDLTCDPEPDDEWPDEWTRPSMPFILELAMLALVDELLTPPPPGWPEAPPDDCLGFLFLVWMPSFRMARGRFTCRVIEASKKAR